MKARIIETGPFAGQHFITCNCDACIDALQRNDSGKYELANVISRASGKTRARLQREAATCSWLTRLARGLQY